MKRRVLITVNPCLVEGAAFSTTRSLITALARHVELLIVPVNSYDFGRGTVRAFRRRAGGGFESLGRIKPAADLWIVYSDGFYLDARRLGFRTARDYFAAQLEFHQQHLTAGAVGLMVNPPEAEARTLKSWLTTFDQRAARVIPTYQCRSFAELHDLLRQEQCLVVKPVWGGASAGVRKLADDAAVKSFQREVESCRDRSLFDYCVQAYRCGDEKRLWFAGGEFVGGRKFHAGATPWSSWGANFRIHDYTKHSRNGFTADLAAAQSLCARGAWVWVRGFHRR